MFVLPVDVEIACRRAAQCRLYPSETDNLLTCEIVKTATLKKQLATPKRIFILATQYIRAIQSNSRFQIKLQLRKEHQIHAS